jgi:LEA14-like dessication related protein
LSVQNPNAMAIPVRGMSYSLQVAGDDFARGVSPKAFTVPAYGETDVQVEMTTNLAGTLRKLQELLSGDRNVVDYELAGELDVNLPFADTIPFRNSGEFRLTQ